MRRPGRWLGACLAAAAVAAGALTSPARPALSPLDPVQVAAAQALAAPSLRYSFVRRSPGVPGSNSAKGAFRSDGSGSATTTTVASVSGTTRLSTVFHQEKGHEIVFLQGNSSVLPVALPKGQWARVDLARLEADRPGTDLSVLYGTPGYVRSMIELLRYARRTGSGTKVTGAAAGTRYQVVIDPLRAAKAAGVSASGQAAVRDELVKAFGSATPAAQVTLDASGQLARLHVVERPGGGVAVDATLELGGYGAAVAVKLPPAGSVTDMTDLLVRALRGIDRSNQVLEELRAVALTDQQAGSGLARADRPDGLGTDGTITLDPCGAHPPSEALRLARLQLDYVRAGSTKVLSNEVVAYKPGGAAQALAEERKASASCTSRTASGGTRSEHAIRPAGLPAGAYAALLEIAEQGKTFRSVAVFLVRGDVLSGVYVTVGDSLAQAEQVAIAAAGQSEANLRRSAAALQAAAQKP